MRYAIVDDSQSGHCCFDYTVVDTAKPFLIHGEHYKGQFIAVCECFDEADAQLICDALNAHEARRIEGGNQMNTHDMIELPPLPPGYTSYEFPDGGYDADEMRAYARRAIEVDRKRKKPLTSERIKILWKETLAEMGGGGDPVVWFARAIERAHGIPAPQPAEPVKVPSDDDIEQLAKQFGFHRVPGTIELARDVLARYGQPVEPEGWQLVPKEPTKEMLAATSWPNCAGTDYKHMLAAAPKFGEEE